MAGQMAANMAPGALGGAGAAVGGLFSKKGARAGRAVGKAIGGQMKKMFHFKRGGRVKKAMAHTYAYGGKVRMPPRAMRVGGLVAKFKHPSRACSCTDRKDVSGVRKRHRI